MLNLEVLKRNLRCFYYVFDMTKNLHSSGSKKYKRINLPDLPNHLQLLEATRRRRLRRNTRIHTEFLSKCLQGKDQSTVQGKFQILSYRMKLDLCLDTPRHFLS